MILRLNVSLSADVTISSLNGGKVTNLGCSLEVGVAVEVLALGRVLGNGSCARTVAHSVVAHVLDNQLAVVVRISARVLVLPKQSKRDHKT